ncbi:hypothetical protein [Knoellia aerolata]|uniref:Uncharacterized protein n=1 Tax=Knoellia aerolata DSM 18566 TaxID=1385519 RepID=A0A0A0JZW8_9MICO|nr:hypothetical protein [Knoellia aerolata]KGN41617.1 hypothetical protein N801_18365 [Knoellia aerolata DSM 18566]
MTAGSSRGWSRRTTAYAVTPVLVLVAVVAVAWLTTPRTSGLEGEWETAAVPGEVLGGRALVGSGSPVAVDLVTGTRITLGSVTGGAPAIGAGRLLVLGDGRLDGAGLDGRSRWTWQGPPAHALTLVAAGPSVTVVQACGGTPGGCRLIGVDGNGRESWQTPQPTATGTSAPVVGADGNLPTVGVLPTPDGTLVLVDPASSRIVLRPASRASVGADGRLTLRSEASGGCALTTLETLDRTSTSTTSEPCASAPPPPGPERVTAARSRVWWWPFGDGRPTLEVRGRHTGRVVSREPLAVLRHDDAGLTVREGDVVRRYGWVEGG